MTKSWWIGLTCALVGVGAGRAETVDERVVADRQILEAYHAGDTSATGRTLHVIAWRARDTAFPADQRARLQGIMEHIQTFYADEMARIGFPRRAFPLAYDAQHRLVLHEVVGDGNDADYQQDGPSGFRIRQDCAAALKAKGIDIDRETILIFSNLAKWDAEQRTFKHHSPYMGSGSARNGTAWQLDHPALAVSNLTNTAVTMQDAEYGRITLAKHNSIFIGGIAHELGHALSLPHCVESDEEKRTRGTALMGSGNRTYGDELRGEGKGSFLTLDSAMRLASHPLFSGSARGLDAKVDTRILSLAVAASSNGFTVSGTVTSAVPVHAMLAYLDPDGGGDYDSRTAVGVPRRDGSFAIDCRGLVPGKSAALRLVACHANGAVTERAYSYRVDPAGRPDVSAMQLGLDLSPFLDALRDPRRAAAILHTLPEGSRSRRIASFVLEGATRRIAQIAPSNVPPAETSVALSQLKPVAARVGWGQPACDALPRQEALLIAGGEIFERGLYAHAPASHRYDLAGGNWKKLTGACGLPVKTGYGEGSVVFVIKGDGREIYRSRRTESNRTRRFEVDITGVRELELITEDAGDGNANDWGLWLGCELRR